MASASVGVQLRTDPNSGDGPPETQELLRKGADGHVALRGDLAATPLIELLSTLGSSGRSAELRVHAASDPCHIWFRNGTLIDATMGRLAGEAAVEQLAGVESGRFEVYYCVVERDRTIHGSAARLLQNGAAKRQRFRELAAREPGIHAVLAPSAPLCPIPSPDGGREPLVFELLDGQRTVREVVECAGMDAVEVLETIHSLHRAGLLKLVRILADSSSFGPVVPKGPLDSGNGYGVEGKSVPLKGTPSAAGPRELSRAKTLIHGSFLPGMDGRHSGGHGAPLPEESGDTEPRKQTASREQRESGNRCYVGRYEVLCRLGRGGMGTVYLCRAQGELGFRRLYALKVLRQRVDPGSEAERLFLGEIYLASRLHHPNIVAVVDAALHDSQPYLVMDYVEGCSLQTLLARGRGKLHSSVVLSIVMDALNGLHAAHVMTDETGASAGLVHCDVSPENLLIGVEGTCRLSDFGVARAHSLPARTTTRGKARYASPEQALGGQLDPRSDVFSMGVVLYEALTGIPLFQGETVDETLWQVVHRDIPRPSQVGLHPPAAIDAVCLRALERDPERRFHSAAEMLVELRRVAVQENLMPSAEVVGQWVRAVAAPELEAQRAAERGEAPKTEWPRARREPGVFTTGAVNGIQAGVQTPGGAEQSEPTSRLLEKERFSRRSALLIAASLMTIAIILVSALFPEVLGSLFRLDLGEAPPVVERTQRGEPHDIEANLDTRTTADTDTGGFAADLKHKPTSAETPRQLASEQPDDGEP